MRALLLLPLLLASCAPSPASAPAPACLAGTEPMLRAELLFGRSRHDGALIGAAEWRDFLARSVTPRFPDGLTALDGDGQWRDRASGTVSREPSTVLLVVAADGDVTRRALDAIRAEYRARFAQESVGLVLTRSCATF